MKLRNFFSLTRYKMLYIFIYIKWITQFFQQFFFHFHSDAILTLNFVAPNFFLGIIFKFLLIYILKLNRFWLKKWYHNCHTLYKCTVKTLNNKELNYRQTDRQLEGERNKSTIALSSTVFSLLINKPVKFSKQKTNIGVL